MYQLLQFVMCLQVGRKFATHRGICELSQQPVKAGTSRKRVDTAKVNTQVKKKMKSLAQQAVHKHCGEECDPEDVEEWANELSAATKALHYQIGTEVCFAKDV